MVFENVFLVASCRQAVVEMKQTATRTAALEHEIGVRQEAEHDARNSRARNDAILDVALDCVVLMDESGHVAQFNPAAERTFGYTAAEAVGRDLAELFARWSISCGSRKSRRRRRRGRRATSWPA